MARVTVPVWRDPWLVVGRATFTGDLLARLRLAQHACAERPGRYPTVDVADPRPARRRPGAAPGRALPLPPEDGPEAFPRTRTLLVSRRLLTWCGPSLLAARPAAARRRSPTQASSSVVQSG
ncbi:MAG: helical backbone metal receptor [Nocardioides sp.]